MRPNPEKHIPKAKQPAFIRKQLDRTRLSPLKIGRAIGLSERVIYYYLDGRRTFPYTVQFALENLPKKP